MTVTWKGVCLLTARIRGSVSVNLEPQDGAVTPVSLDTPGEEVEPAAQVHRASVTWYHVISDVTIINT